MGAGQDSGVSERLTHLGPFPHGKTRVNPKDLLGTEIREWHYDNVTTLVRNSVLLSSLGGQDSPISISAPASLHSIYFPEKDHVQSFCGLRAWHSINVCSVNKPRFLSQHHYFICTPPTFQTDLSHDTHLYCQER